MDPLKAQAALLTQRLGKFDPRALAGSLTRRYAQSEAPGSDLYGRPPNCNTEYFQARGFVLVDRYTSVQSGSSEIFGGTCLVLLEDGWLAELTRSGTIAGEYGEWSAMLQHLSPEEAVTRYGLEACLEKLGPMSSAAFMPEPEQRYHLEVEALELRLMDRATQQPLVELSGYGLLREVWRPDHEGLTIEMRRTSATHSKEVMVTFDIPRRVCIVQAPMRSRARDKPVEMPFEQLKAWLNDFMAREDTTPRQPPNPETLRRSSRPTSLEEKKPNTLPAPERRYRLEVEMFEERFVGIIPEVRRLRDLSTQQTLLELEGFGILRETWRADNQGGTIEMKSIYYRDDQFVVTFDIPTRVCVVQAPLRNGAPGKPVHLPFEQLQNWLKDWAQGKIVIQPLFNET